MKPVLLLTPVLLSLQPTASGRHHQDLNRQMPGSFSPKEERNTMGPWTPRGKARLSIAALAFGVWSISPAIEPGEAGRFFFRSQYGSGALEPPGDARFLGSERWIRT